MTVLVTGGSGLVGSHVIEALRSRGVRVRAMVRSNAASRAAVSALGAEPVTGDVTDPAAWRAAADGVRAIVHAAALVGQHATLDTFTTVNVEGTRHACAAARAVGARLVHVSSVAVYGRSTAYRAGREGRTVTEESPLGPIEPRDFYARTKRLAEEALWAEVARGGLWAVAIRPNVLYGERDRLFSPRVARVVRRGVVPQIGAGRNRLSCTYAGNVAAAIVAALDADVPSGRAYLVTHDAGGGLTQREFVTTFADCLGRRVRRVRVPLIVAALGIRAVTAMRRVLHPGAYGGVGDAAAKFLAGENPYTADRAARELNWRPPFEPGVAIRRTVRWVLEQWGQQTKSPDH